MEILLNHLLDFFVVVEKTLYLLKPFGLGPVRDIVNVVIHVRNTALDCLGGDCANTLVKLLMPDKDSKSTRYLGE
jgi:hypothetical protein